MPQIWFDGSPNVLGKAAAASAQIENAGPVAGSLGNQAARQPEPLIRTEPAIGLTLVG